MPSRSLLHRGLPLLALLLAVACGPRPDEAPVVRTIGTRSAALAAYCTATIQGSGALDVEEDYLPHVVACENGAADDEALRAQAVAARSYLYYKLDRGDPVADGQSDQVYTCGNAPTQRHYDAVATTAGEVLRYRDTQIAAFYVAGAVPSADDCVALPGDNDYSGTEHYVTYNWGNAAEGLEQTSLGWVNAANYQNRGCQSQNGANCLSQQGWGYEDILRFYYGMDIEHVVAEGDCVVPTGLAHGCGLVVSEEETVYDESGGCFIRGCASGPAWAEHDVGAGGGALVTGGYESPERDCFGRWQLSFASAGEYVVDVHVPDLAPLVSEATYVVRHAAQDTTVVVPQASVGGWVTLGTFAFDVGSFQYVELSDLAPEDGTVQDGPWVVFDAVRVRRAGTPPSDAGVLDAGDPGEDAADDAGRDAGVPDEEDAGVDDDDASVDLGDLPPSVVYECACVAARQRTAGGGMLALLAGGALVVRRRRAGPRSSTGW